MTISMTTEQRLDLLMNMIDVVNEKTNILEKMIQNITETLTKVYIK